MASPAVLSPAQPLTPPADPTNTQTQTQTSQTQATQPLRVEALLSQPLTSLTDDGSAKRPRDHRLIHLLLAAKGVTAYQERVPLQLMDFAYRYTSGILSDAVHIQNEGYDLPDNQHHTGGANRRGRGGGGAGGGRGRNDEEGDISLASLRMSIQSRLGYQFNGSLPKEYLKQLADERNRIALAPSVRYTAEDEETGRVGPIVGGIRLPSEKYCLTGLSWGLNPAWESDGEESEEEDKRQVNGDGHNSPDGMEIDGLVQEEGMEEDEDEEGGGRMEDIFGEDPDRAGDQDGDLVMK